MASAVLTFVGNAVAGPIGGFIGNVIGTMIDNQLFPVKTEGPRLTDLTMQSSAYGQAIPMAFGPENRMAGNVIWSSGLIETKKKSRNSGKGGPAVETTEYTYRCHVAVAVCEGTISGVKKIWANSKLIFDADAPQADNTFEAAIGAVLKNVNGSALYSAIRVYPGDHTQNPDPTIESYLGMGNVPAYRGTAYVVLVDFQLADYGNRLPNLEFLVEAHERLTVGAAAREVVIRAGIDPHTVSYTGGWNQELRGYVIGRSTNADTALQPLSVAYNFDVADQGGSLRLVARGSFPKGVVPMDDLAGHVDGEEMPLPLRWSRQAETAMPRQAAVTFRDPERDYQPNTAPAVRDGGTSENNLATELAITMDADLGQRVADRLLWEAWNARDRVTGTTTDRWKRLTAGCVYLFETPAGLEPLRVLRRTRGFNGVIEFEAAREYLQVYRSDATGFSGEIPENNLTIPGPTTLVPMDTAIFADEDDNSGFYYVVAGGEGWRGADILRSTDGGSSYNEAAVVGTSAVIGTVSYLPSGPTDYWDRATVLTVALDNEEDELESVTELDVLNGANAAWIGPEDGQGGEVIQFATATEVAPGVWELSDLLRGRLGTEHAVGSHTPTSSNERFVLLDTTTLNRADFGPQDWNKQRLYKPVSVMTSPDDAASQSFTNTGEGKRPLSPVHVAGERDSSDNLTISWMRRSRMRQPGLGNGNVPLGEATELYEIDIYDGAAVVRTITVSAATTASYSAADQTSDGLTPGDTVHCIVYQISDVRGRGHGAEAFI